MTAEVRLSNIEKRGGEGEGLLAIQKKEFKTGGEALAPLSSITGHNERRPSSSLAFLGILGAAKKELRDRKTL